MKKIMFNDKYGLTKAVLEGRKTQTRRVLNPTMLFERLKTFDGWTKEAISDWKQSCKERLYQADGEVLKRMLDYALSHSPYKVGEKVAIAQRYIDLADNEEFYRLCGIHGMPLECIKYEKGCKNKMFVKADLMPYHIHIKDVRIERLQDISEEDCLAEGIVDFESKINKAHFYSITDKSATYSTPRKPFAQLIDKLSGKGTWASNPFVFVYEFNLYQN